MAEEEHPPNWLARFRERVDRFPNLYKIENLTIEQISSLERLVTLEQTLQKTTTELELLGQDAAARREILREDAGARLRLLNRITWLVSGIVGADIVLLGVVVWASIWLSYKPDSWLSGLLASGPPAAIVGMLTTIVGHYWRRSGPGEIKSAPPAKASV